MFYHRYCPPPPSCRGLPPWVRHLRGQREALAKRQTEKDSRDEYITSLETKRTYPPYVIEALRNIDHDKISMELIFELIKVICRDQELGAILVFLPGWDTISKLHDMLKADPVFRSRQYVIIPLHSLMPTSFQQSVRTIHVEFYMYLYCRNCLPLYRNWLYTYVCTGMYCCTTVYIQMVPHCCYRYLIDHQRVFVR